MITETGGNLSVLIVTEPGLDWQTFATWYSFYKNWPDAKVAINCLRNGMMPFAFYQWAKRLNVPSVRQNRHAEGAVNWLYALKNSLEAGHVGENVLVVAPLVMALDLIPELTLAQFDAGSHFDSDVWFLKEPDPGKMLDNFFLESSDIKTEPNCLCLEAKDAADPAFLVSYKKGCGKWIHRAKGCPFSSAGGLIAADMTANEHKIIDLWQKMVALYNVVA